MHMIVLYILYYGTPVMLSSLTEGIRDGLLMIK